MKARFIDLQKSRLIKGEISRRQFIRSALATGVGMTGALSLANAAEANVVPKGGMLRIALRGHDLPFAFGTALTEVQADGALTGALAESWASDPAAKDWQFRLRRDVTFPSGAVLTAGDAWASLSGAAVLLDAGLQAGLAEGEDLLTLRFQTSVPDLPLWLSNAALIIRQALGMRSGAGPYQISETGQATRFDGWYRGRATYDSLTLDADATLDDLASGQIGALIGATPDEREQAQRLGLTETDTCGLLQVLADARLTTPRALRDPIVILGPGVTT
jgi:MarR-like DNA-binding transcriptional regulator SgrR of sgrS sRNA